MRLIASMAFLSACVTPGGRSPLPEGPRTTLEIAHQNFSRADIYVRAGADRFRVAWINRGGAHTVAVPTMSAHTIQFEVILHPSEDRWMSDPMPATE
jgi:hypothetical protein